MPRKPFVPGAALVVAAALAAGLTACTGGSGSDGEEGDAKSGGTSTSSQAAEPGRYQTLPEACGLPARSSLRGMLPGDGQQLSRDEAKKIYDGQPDITYDTDRRVGCRWTRETTAGTRHLSLDIQRVVSYDAAVSDDSEAQGIYDTKALDAKIPSGGNGSPSPSTRARPPPRTRARTRPRARTRAPAPAPPRTARRTRRRRRPPGAPRGRPPPPRTPARTPARA